MVDSRYKLLRRKPFNKVLLTFVARVIADHIDTHRIAVGIYNRIDTDIFIRFATNPEFSTTSIKCFCRS